jgi:hypothetical protein
MLMVRPWVSDDEITYTEYIIYTVVIYKNKITEKEAQINISELLSAIVDMNG